MLRTIIRAQSTMVSQMGSQMTKTFSLRPLVGATEGHALPKQPASLSNFTQKAVQGIKSRPLVGATESCAAPTETAVKFAKRPLRM